MQASHTAAHHSEGSEPNSELSCTASSVRFWSNPKAAGRDPLIWFALRASTLQALQRARLKCWQRSPQAVVGQQKHGEGRERPGLAPRLGHNSRKLVAAQVEHLQEPAACPGGRQRTRENRRVQQNAAQIREGSPAGSTIVRSDGLSHCAQSILNADVC